MKKLFSLFAAFLFVGSLWATEVTAKWTIASKSELGSGIGTGTVEDDHEYEWAYERTLVSGASYTGTGLTNGYLQLGKNGGVENLSFTTSDIPGTIKSVSVDCASYNGAHRVSITVGSSTYLSSTAVPTWSSNTGGSKSGTGTSSGTITIAFTSGTRALYIKSITVVYDNGGEADPVLQSIAVSSTPTTKTYEEGDVFDVAGLVVTGTYDKGDPATISEGITWKARTSALSDDAVALANYTLTVGQTSLQVQATVSGINSDWYDVTGLTVNEHVIKPGTYDIVPANALWGTSYSGTVNTPPASLSGSKNDVSVTFNRNTHGGMYVNDTETKAYNGYTVVLSVPSGYEIKQVVFTGTTWVAPAVNVDVMTGAKTWKGVANSVTFTFSGTSDVENISVTYAAVDPLAGKIAATPNSVLAHSEGEVGSIAIAYTNISDMDNVYDDIVLYDDAEHTIESTTAADWLLVAWNQDKTAIEYVAEINTGSTNRVAYLYIYASDDQGGDVEKVILFTQSKCDFATLPFDYSGGRENIANTPGLSHTGLGTDYGTGNPPLKFDGQDDNLVLKINESAGTLTFDIKGQPSGSANNITGTFKVQKSVDGESYSDLAVYENLGKDTQSKEINNIASDIRYIKWIYSAKTSGNVALGNINLTKSSSTALETVETSAKAVKVLRNGVLYIEKAGKTYNAQGQLVK